MSQPVRGAQTALKYHLICVCLCVCVWVSVLLVGYHPKSMRVIPESFAEE